MAQGTVRSYAEGCREHGFLGHTVGHTVAAVPTRPPRLRKRRPPWGPSELMLSPPLQIQTDL